LVKLCSLDLLLHLKRYTSLTTNSSPRYTTGGKARKRNTLTVQGKEPIFDQTLADYSVPEGDQGSNITTRKRKPTPASVTNLRRSKRQAGCNDGFKPSSLAVTRGKGKIKKRHAGLGSFVGKTHTFLIPLAEFLDLTEIDRCVSTQLIHPHISVPILQKVAQEVCGIPPMEVSTEVLLEAHKPHSEEESSNKLQIVPYGYF
jgi:hypothetical protein